MTPRHVVYGLLDQERDYQNETWPHSENLTVGDELLLLGEYVDRARREWSQEDYPEVRALAEIRKIAAIAVRCMENHGAVAREVTNDR